MSEIQSTNVTGHWFGPMRYFDQYGEISASDLRMANKLEAIEKKLDILIDLFRTRWSLPESLTDKRSE